ncbi:MAG: hypothetical protein KF841_10465 [Phycisphaerae bacterium]|nr:hypothetical protein [Phycisphaerae bacterium]
MCGIFGIVIGDGAEASVAQVVTAVSGLFTLSETRGKESAGLAVVNGGPIQVLKQAIPASVMVRSRAFNEIVRGSVAEAGDRSGSRGPLASAALIGHSRLVTNGAQERNCNNQPVVADGMVAIHNGIITNDADLWAKYPQLTRSYEIDTEVLLRLIHLFLSQGLPHGDAVRAAFREIEGYASVAVLFDDRNELLLATNNGSLYWVRPSTSRIIAFASEEYILRTLIGRRDLRSLFGSVAPERIEPGYGLWIAIDTLATSPFGLFGESGRGATDPTRSFGARTASREIIDVSDKYEAEFAARRVRVFKPILYSSNDNQDLLFEHLGRVRALKRCAKCVLPETYPFIRFDAAGVCNHCNSPRRVIPKGSDALAAAVERYRRSDGRPDCLVAVSGGRDSIYGLHYMKQVLKMNPIAYTYDWGMVTDLARRNISRICGKLGVEHILVSADINKKRANIRRNILAWLRRPDMGVIPLFMAGDKQFYYYCERMRKQTGVDLVIWCSGSGLEDTKFKWGLCGINTRLVNFRNKLRLSAYYARQFAMNPAYINRSLLDTVFAFYSYYVIPHDYIYLFSYLPWDENELLSVLRSEYDWELASDTKQTWRIGDGTASFYNYIYHRVCGFSENDTFRSEQIRRGMITRDEALKHIEYENRPRYESIKWYLGIIGLDDAFNRVIETINCIPTRYGS